MRLLDKALIIVGIKPMYCQDPGYAELHLIDALVVCNPNPREAIPWTALTPKTKIFLLAVAICTGTVRSPRTTFPGVNLHAPRAPR